MDLFTDHDYDALNKERQLYAALLEVKLCLSTFSSMRIVQYQQIQYASVVF